MPALPTLKSLAERFQLADLLDSFSANGKFHLNIHRAASLCPEFIGKLKKRAKSLDEAVVITDFPRTMTSLGRTQFSFWREESLLKFVETEPVLEYELSTISIREPTSTSDQNVSGNDKDIIIEADTITLELVLTSMWQHHNMSVAKFKSGRLVFPAWSDPKEGSRFALCNTDWQAMIRCTLDDLITRLSEPPIAHGPASAAASSFQGAAGEGAGTSSSASELTCSR